MTLTPNELKMIRNAQSHAESTHTIGGKRKTRKYEPSMPEPSCLSRGADLCKRVDAFLKEIAA